MAHPEVQMSRMDTHASAPSFFVCSSSLGCSAPQRTCLPYTRQHSKSDRRAVYTSVLVHQLSFNCTRRGPKNKDKRGKRRFAGPTFSISASAASALEKPILDAESDLIDALIGIEGRGRGTGLAKLETISAAVRSLESLGGVDEPTSSSLIEGTWRLVFTTRPGTASPIQRAFVGVDTFSVFQEIKLRGTDDPRVCNIVQFSKAIGKLKVEAAASIASGRRILFQFDKAAFSFNFLPFKVPYPVPFRLLGDEAKGWLETTYLSPSGNIRISRGNKGTTFILQKEVNLRQQLLQAIASGQGVEKTIEELLPQNPTKNSTDLQYLSGQWRLIWSSQTADANWLQKATTRFPSWQIVEAETGRLQNLAEFFPGLKLRTRARSDAISAQRLNINIEGASLEVGSVELPLKITGSGFTEVLYLDTKIRITRGNKGSTFVHVRDE